jgi:NTP pyrophosphatase (non-canonical NTP hydrolase)
MELTFEQLIDKVLLWADDKNILKSENKAFQMLKVTEEIGEVAAAVARDDEALLRDGIGDAFVTLIILAGQAGLDPTECLQQAWDEIKDRKGRTEGGVFIKDELK